MVFNSCDNISFAEMSIYFSFTGYYQQGLKCLNFDQKRPSYQLNRWDALKAYTLQTKEIDNRSHNSNYQPLNLLLGGKQH